MRKLILGLLIVLLLSAAPDSVLAQGPVVTPPPPNPIDRFLQQNAQSQAQIAALTNQAASDNAAAQAALNRANATNASLAAASARAAEVQRQIQAGLSAQALETATQSQRDVAQATIEVANAKRDAVLAVIQSNQTSAKLATVIAATALSSSQLIQYTNQLQGKLADSQSSLTASQAQNTTLTALNDTYKTTTVLLGFDIIISAILVILVWRRLWALQHPVTIIEEHHHEGEPAGDTLGDTPGVILSKSILGQFNGGDA